MIVGINFESIGLQISTAVNGKWGRSYTAGLHAVCLRRDADSSIADIVNITVISDITLVCARYNTQSKKYECNI
jgi:hypothetical protein